MAEEIIIEKNIKIDFINNGRPTKYKDYLNAFMSMDYGDSFVVKDYKIVDAVRNYAWKQKVPCKFRTIAKEKYRIWKVTDEDFS
tara:strand:- start:1717 stop:1968 length:252 start_codon:yes stop_codon:yes gene_type:complete